MAKSKTVPAEKTILVVDDEFGIIEVLESILTDAGFRVVTAMNGQDALERLHESVPDLAIIDFMMPRLDGAGVLKAMRSDDGLRAVPVIIASALAENVVKERCSGYDVFLRKPFKTERLFEEIDRLLAKASTTSGSAET